MPKLSWNIIEAIRNNNISQLQSKITNTNVNYSDYSGWSSLLHAAQYGRLEIIKLLLDRGANIHHSDKYGYTSLLVAAQYRKLEVLQLLIREGANVNIANKVTIVFICRHIYCF